ncbi:DoxX family membrane protein [Phycicoccus endophyticus]|uniref:DoxX family membrane protein n=1 Tax=Phycicoccus endophyticus TaxID=1690220 RepID=A0A7G9R4B5_9MICO|nr:MauE/DoxX family redox-associated membrane protein [Phycicoccus endophyticus]NHI18304.1 DoxX family membrane protein [Phycicoccus endophyticus]QNN50440.1 DoxX family membrane protein [Phycicoccus endophyticus]GGL24864.1 hypothetical protein GCM10012283_03710 [Phycicoccus endophyticus]
MSVTVDEVDAEAAVPWYRRGRTLDVVGLLARLLLGVVLVWAGAAKVGHPLTSQRAVQAYQIFPFELAGWIGLALPFLEIVVGVLLLLGLFTRPAAVVGALLMLAFIAGIAQAWARGLSIDCGCFGGGGEIAPSATRYPEEIARDTGFALAGGWLAWRPRSLASLDRILFGH